MPSVKNQVQDGLVEESGGCSVTGELRHSHTIPCHIYSVLRRQFVPIFLEFRSANPTLLVWFRLQEHASY